jgi:hypothetical protein
MGFGTLGDVIAAATVSGRSQRWQKSTSSPPPAGEFKSMWKSGEIPTQGADPSPALTARQVTNATPGAINMGFPSPGRSIYLHRAAGLVATANGHGTLLLVDRLLDYGSLDHNIGTVQTMSNPVSLSRYTSGSGVLAFLETSGGGWVFGPGGMFISITYTNELGVAGRVRDTIILDDSTAGNIPHRPMWLELEPGDQGIRSVQSVQFPGPLIAGTSNLVLVKPILAISLPMSGVLFDRTLVEQNTIIPKLEEGHALQWIVTSTITAFGGRTYFGELFAVEG